MAPRVSGSRALRRLADPLIESIHDVALLTRAVMGVVIARDLDGGVAGLFGAVEQVA